MRNIIPIYARFISGSFLFALLLCFNAFGQSDSANLSSNRDIFNNQLQILIDETVKDNPALKSSAYGIESVKANVHILNTLDPPWTMVDFYQAPISSFPNPFKDQMEIDYLMLQMFPFPGKLSSMGSAEERRALMLGADRKTLEQTLIQSIKAAFFELYFIYRKLEINDQGQVLVKNLVEITRKQYELGLGKQSDILRAQTELSSLANDRILLEQSKKSIEYVFVKASGLKSLPSWASKVNMGRKEMVITSSE